MKKVSRNGKLANLPAQASSKAQRTKKAVEGDLKELVRFMRDMAVSEFETPTLRVKFTPGASEPMVIPSPPPSPGGSISDDEMPTMKARR